MHVISKKRLRVFWSNHPEAEAPLDRWYRIAEKADWPHFAAVRQDFPQADQVGKFTVFNIGGNKHRLVTQIYHENQVLLVRDVLTHAEYDQGKWKTWGGGRIDG
jgi:mRNA interferase HigB